MSTTLTTEEREGGDGSGKERRRRRTLSVSERTYNELQKLGQYGDSASDIIDRCIAAYRRLEKIEGRMEEKVLAGEVE
jgi:predicted CopG family antitoxin